MKTSAIAPVFLALLTASSAYAQKLPNMPAPNPWLADGPYPISHDNSVATNSVLHAGPTKGKQLTASDVKTVPVVFVSNPTVKKEGADTIIIASRRRRRSQDQSNRRGLRPRLGPALSGS